MNPATGTTAPNGQNGASGIPGAAPRAGKKAPAKPPAAPLPMSTVARLGKRYFARHPFLVAGYILGALLCQPILSVSASLKFSELTNYFQNRNAETGDHGPSALPAPPSGSQELPKNPPSAASPGSADSDDAHPLSKNELLPVYFTWFGLTIAVVLCTFGQKVLTAQLSNKVANAIRRDAFDAVLKESPRFFFENNADRLTAIINQFCNVAQMGLRQLLIDPILQLINLVTVGFALYYKIVDFQKGGAGQTWWILSMIGVVALISPSVVIIMGKFLERDTDAAQNQNIAVSTLVGGALKAAEEIQAMRAEPIFGKKQADLLETSLSLALRQTVTVERLNVLNRLPGDLVLISLIGFAVYSALMGKGGNPGTIVALALLTPQFMGAVNSLSSFWINKSMSSPSISLINKILESKPDVIVQPGAKDFDQVESRIEARNLVFSYKPGTFRNVLDDISFSLPPGKVTGFVARPGQGKTTFFRLALRFYDPQSGGILIGGTPTTAFTLSSLRRHIVLMSQFPAFFYDTIRENFLIAKPTATDEEIRALAIQTQLWNKLEANFGPDPLDRDFAAGGPLSGGQKKLFALTRCLLRDPTFLFLDEPTTGMGPKEKFPLITVMRAACVDKTVVVVDHDIAWQAHFCDHIIVLNDGKIIQEGPPNVLRSQPGLFKELFDQACEGCASPTLASQGATQMGPTR
jgi:ABC-type multidrug transport system fused ATPase/permease subunit